MSGSPFDCSGEPETAGGCVQDPGRSPCGYAAAFTALVADGWISAAGDNPEDVFATREHPGGERDLLCRKSPLVYEARREDAEQRVVWRHAAGLAELVGRLRDLPPPDHPDAPVAPIDTSARAAK